MPIHARNEMPMTVDDLENAFRGLWREALGVERIDGDSNYFQLGGDSLQLIRIVARARKMGINVSTGDALSHPTIAGLSAYIAQTSATGTPGDGQAAGKPESTRGPLTSAQLGILFQCEAADDHSLYVSKLEWTWCGPLDFDMLCLAWNRMLVGHDVLRVCFGRDSAGIPVQIVAKEVECEVHFERCADVEEAGKRLVESWSAAMRDLRTPPLVRLGVVEIARDRYRIFMVNHHLVLDGWSQSLLLNRLLATYSAYVQGQPADDEDPASFVAIAGGGATDVDALAFWTGYMSGRRAARRLVPVPAGRGVATSDVREIRCTPEDTRQLAALAQASSCTVATLVQLAWATALAVVSGSGDLLFGLVLSGRDARPDLADVVGMLISTVPIRAKFEPEDRIGEWLGSHQRSLARVTAHGHVSLTTLARHGILPGGVPFDSMVVVENIPAVAGECDGVKFEDVRFDVREAWPIVLVAFPGTQLTLQVKYDASLPGAEAAAAQLHLALAAIVRALKDSSLETPLGTLREAAVPVLAPLSIARRERIDAPAGTPLP